MLAGFSLNVFAKCIEGNCLDGKGTLLNSDGQKYVGGFKNDEMSGKGIMIYPNLENMLGNEKKVIWMVKAFYMMLRVI